MQQQVQSMPTENLKSDIQIPRPFGEIIGQSRWEELFLRIVTTSPTLNIYDGESDYLGNLVQPDLANPDNPLLVVEATQPEYVREIIEREKRILVRGQFYDQGLHHRVSFQCFMLRKKSLGDMQVAVLQIIPPIKTVSNLIISYPMNEEQVFLEIPVVGAPPEVRLHTTSLGQLGAFASHHSRLRPKTRTVEEQNVQFIDLADSALFTEIFDEDEQDYEEFNEQLDPLHKTAIIILRSKPLRKKFLALLDELGWKCLLFSDFLEVVPEDYESGGLLIIDAIQDGHHAVELLRTLKRDGVQRPKHFVIVANTEDQAKRDKWKGLGRGAFVNPRVSDPMLIRTLQSLLNQEVDEVDYAPNEIALPKIMLLSENEDVIARVNEALDSEHCQLTDVNSAKDAIRHARYQNPALVILDLEVRNKDAFKALHILKSFTSTRSIPIIVCGRQQGLDVAHKVYKQGVRDFLPLNFDKETLFNRVFANLSLR